MNLSKRVTAKVLIATFLSIYLGVILYSTLLPMAFFYSEEKRLDFWRRMVLVVNVIGPVALLTVYLFYKPIAKSLKDREAGRALQEEDLERLVQIFGNIEMFLFIVGFLTYFLGAVFNFTFEWLSGSEINLEYWLKRLLLAVIFGLLNGIITARMVNLAWIEAKYSMGITLFSGNRKKQTMLVKLGTPLVLLFLVFAAFYYVSVQNFKEIVQKGYTQVSNENFEFFIGFLLTICLILLFFILLENQAHIKNLQNQVSIMSQGKMDLTSRIKIIFFDDIGSLTSGMNQIINNLQTSFKAIEESGKKVYDSTLITKNILDKSQKVTLEVVSLIDQVKKTEDDEAEIVRKVIEDFKLTLQHIFETLTLSKRQNEFIKKTYDTMNNIVKSFSNISEMNLLTNRRFQKLNISLDGVSKDFTSLLDSYKQMILSYDRIKELAKMIMDISEQSNILAINAAIEAAHSGSSGKGFAVVAMEVRKLAQTTSDSARQIDGFIKNLEQQFTNLGRLNLTMRSVLDAVQGEISQTAAQMNDIAKSSQEEVASIKSGLEEMARLVSIASEIEEASRKVEAIEPKVKQALVELGGISKQLSEVHTAIVHNIENIVGGLNELARASQGNYDSVKALEEVLSRYRSS